MDTSKLMLLLTHYRHRELPKDYTFLSPAAEVAALLKEHALEKQRWGKEQANREKAHNRLVADITSLAYLFDEAVTRFQSPLEGQGLRRVHRELSVLKNKLVQILQEGGYTWRDPMGEPFEGDLPDLVNVDGWRYKADYKENHVVQVREPIILHNSIPIKEGSVVIGAPELPEENSPSALAA